ncbi:hypothetical protein L1049_002486 [Liquidambar formosana]|uniref:Bifunctional inhibitor/plant lipid transfer protein/seed storage helical domain-containing protein n=1 Tax=Liquidambar formosana TaxID=63359 RepID=A0AAP0R9B3_LIQFO
MEGMRGSSSSRGLMLLLGFTVLMGVCRVRMVNGVEVSPSQCTEERRLAINACKPVVYGQPASSACCERVRVSHFECACPAVTPKLAALIDVNRAIKLLQDCGRRVPRHFKCGSKTFFLSDTYSTIYFGHDLINYVSCRSLFSMTVHLHLLLLVRSCFSASLYAFGLAAGSA